MRPILAEKSLPHFEHLKASLPLEEVRSLRASLLASASLIREASYDLLPFVIAALQQGLFGARLSHVKGLMLKFFRDIFRASLYRFFGAPTFRFPEDSSE